jgi:hypothetical protein
MANTRRERFVRVGVFDGASKRIVAEVTLPPGSDVVVGSERGCTVPLPESLGIKREELILRGELLAFARVDRVNMIADGNQDHVAGTPEELSAAGLSSPVELRWDRLNITLLPKLSVFIKYMPEGQSIDPNATLRSTT